VRACDEDIGVHIHDGRRAHRAAQRDHGDHRWSSGATPCPALTYRFGVPRGVTVTEGLRPLRNIAFIAAVIAGALTVTIVAAQLLSSETPEAVVDGPRATLGPFDRTPAPLEGPAPNVVLIIADGQRAEDVRRMPNVQRLLAARGVTFTNAFASTAMGTPSRVTMLTGQNAFKTRFFDNGKPESEFTTFDATRTIPAWLRESGYVTSHVGKYAPGRTLREEKGGIPAGWSDWHEHISAPRAIYYNYSLDDNGKVTRFGRTRDDYVTDVLADRATSFIAATSDRFFLQFGSVALQDPASPAVEDFGSFADEPPLRRPSFDLKATGDVPAADLAPMPDDRVRYIDGYRRNALAAMRSLDRAVGRIVEAVERRGEIDETVFIYTSDKGILLGEHRILNSVWPYEEAIHVPLVIRAPWLSEAVTDTRLVSLADIVPTIAELTGAKTKIKQDGLSLAPLLHGDRVPWRQEILVTYLGRRPHAGVPPRFRAIRTDRFKLVVYEDRSRELFDLQSDPDELKNLAGTRDAAEIEEPLFRRLTELMPALPVIEEDPATSEPDATDAPED
jgi:N-acetylglucosamine-6-sulfatase